MNVSHEVVATYRNAVDKAEECRNNWDRQGLNVALAIQELFAAKIDARLANNTPFKLTDKQMEDVVDQCDDDAGFLVKESTLRWLIERAVNEDRKTR